MTLAVKLESPTETIRFDCYSTDSFSGGQLVFFTDAFKISGASITEGQYPFAGIVAAEKSSLDGSTSVAVHTKGLFDIPVTSAGADVPVGSLVVLSGTNAITAKGVSADNILSGAIVGKALETGSAGEVIKVKVGSLI